MKLHLMTLPLPHTNFLLDELNHRGSNLAIEMSKFSDQLKSLQIYNGIIINMSDTV